MQNDLRIPYLSIVRRATRQSAWWITLPVIAVLFAGTPAAASGQAASAAAEELYADGADAYREGTREGLERAADLWARAAAAYRTAGDRADEARTLNLVGRVHRSLSQADSALFYYAQALSIRRALGDRFGEAVTLTHIGHVHRSADRPDSALAYFAQALPIVRATGDSSDEATVINVMGVLQRDLGRPDSALAYFTQALRIRRAIGDRSGEALTLTSVGHLHQDLGRPDSALAHYTLALPIQRAIGERTGEAATLTGIGHVHQGSGRPDSALVYFTQALPIWRAVGDRSGEATTLGHIGLVQHGLGRPDSALAYYARALPIHRAVGNRAGVAATLNGIGGVHRDLGRPDSALAYFTRALPIRRAVGDRAGEAVTLSNIGAVHRRLGKADSALVYFAQSLPIQRSVGDRAGEGVTLLNIGQVHRERLEPDSALVYYGRALSIMRTVGNRSAEAVILGNIGEAHSFLGRPDSALAYYAQSLPILRAVGNRSEEGSTLAAIAREHRRPTLLTSRRLAVAYYDSAAAVRAAIAERAGGDQNRLSFAEQDVWLFQDWALAWLALAREIGSVQSAAAALAITEQGRAQALLDLMRVSATDFRREARGGNRARAPATNRTQEGERLARNVSGSSASLAYLVTRDTLVAWLILPGGEMAHFRSRISLHELAFEVAAFRSSLGADSAAVRDRMALRSAAALEDPRGFETAAQAPDPTAARGAAERLAAALLPQELLDRLPETGELVVVPHSVLNLLPFAALPINAQGELLGTRYALRYAPSLSTLVELSDRGAGMSAAEARARALVVGDPSMPEVRSYTGHRVRLGQLPGAHAEGQWVAEQVGGRSLTGAEASESRIRELLPAATFVHLATHGYAYGTEALARQSFIALAPDALHDGLLTVGEVLDDIPSLAAELVVLSACQTGLGDLKQAEGTVGLQRAFLAKGARSVLVSLWSVSDEATDLLMRSFYQYWFAGESKAEALRRAQDEVRTTPGFAEPRYWAAFQLIGAP